MTVGPAFSATISATRSFSATGSFRAAPPGRRSMREVDLATRSEEVLISRRAVELRAHVTLLRAALVGVEAEVGRTSPDSVEGAPPPMDLSPEATADRILNGITGTIYAGFRQRQPDATPEEFEQFQADVLRGFGQGLREAQDILEGLRVLDEKLEAEIDRSEALVREGLEEFFATERASFASARPS